MKKKKYVMPEIDREGIGPQLAEYIAFVEELTRDANAAYEEMLAVKAELTRLRKAKKRSKRK